MHDRARPQAYRGPVDMATLHYLFSSHAIGSTTYVYAEHLADNHQWVSAAECTHPSPTPARPHGWG